MSLPHSSRSALKATYTPIAPGRGRPIPRTTAQWALITHIAPRTEELGRSGPDVNIRKALDAWARSDHAGTMNVVAEIPRDDLRAAVQRIVDARRTAAATNVDLIGALAAAYRKQAEARPAAAPSTISRAAVPTAVPGVVVTRTETAPPPTKTKRRGTAKKPRVSAGTGVTELYQRVPAATLTPAPTATIAPDPDVGDVLAWAAGDAAHADQAATVQRALRQLGVEPNRVAVSDVGTALLDAVRASDGALSAFDAIMKVEPVGLLNLERLEFEPSGIERGELVYSVPMAPGEEVNITHVEWSNTSSEFESIVQDELENYSEQGVTEKSELAQTTQSQVQHSSSLSAGVTASGGYGPVTVTTSVSGSVADAASQAATQSRHSSMDLTRKASSRAKQEHKNTFKLASASGTQDQAVRRFVNPYTDKASRVDYYQLMRRWQVNHYRYGLRLTYDLTIPEPGSDIMSRIREIDELTTTLSEGFGTSDAVASWAKFDLLPSQITRENYMTKASTHGAVVPHPPLQYLHFDPVKTHLWKEQDDASHLEFFTIEVTIPEDYEIDMVSVDKQCSIWTDHDGENDNDFEFWLQSVADFVGTSGTRALVYRTKWLGTAFVELRVRAALAEAPFADWQLKAWAAIRDAAKARYDEHRVFLQDRLSKLSESLGAQDALSLRKAELDEIMKGVLRFLFGPDFAFNPSGLKADLYGKSEALKSKQLWSKVIAWGQTIEFLHQAIEWENVLYFLFPYFWSNVSRWEEKKYLEHPDPLHREFLKAGSARVVITVRPGFERDFISLLETGVLGNTHPYMTIVDQIEAFARTNYPGIPPANPEAADAAHKGELIGTWYEYMPTSALDIAFGETTPTE